MTDDAIPDTVRSTPHVPVIETENRVYLSKLAPVPAPQSIDDILNTIFSTFQARLGTILETHAKGTDQVVSKAYWGGRAHADEKVVELERKLLEAEVQLQRVQAASEDLLAKSEQLERDLKESTRRAEQFEQEIEDMRVTDPSELAAQIIELKKNHNPCCAGDECENEECPWILSKEHPGVFTHE
jgi:DNA repair exonuclease SbcCD ATPase subunit